MPLNKAGDWIRDRELTLVFLPMFMLFWVGQLATGLAVLRHNRRARLARDHGMPNIPTEPIGSIPRPLP